MNKYMYLHVCIYIHIYSLMSICVYVHTHTMHHGPLYIALPLGGLLNMVQHIESLANAHEVPARSVSGHQSSPGLPQSNNCCVDGAKAKILEEEGRERGRQERERERERQTGEREGERKGERKKRERCIYIYETWGDRERNR